MLSVSFGDLLFSIFGVLICHIKRRAIFLGEDNSMLSSLFGTHVLYVQQEVWAPSG